MRGEGEAPDFQLTDQSGRPVRLSELGGRVVVLYFYPRAGAPGCTREAQKFNELLDEFESLGAVVIGVSTDGQKALASFAERLGLRFRLLSDEDGEVARAYGVLKRGTKRPSAERVTFVIDRDGRAVKTLRNVRPAPRYADEALNVVREFSTRGGLGSNSGR